MERVNGCGWFASTTVFPSSIHIAELTHRQLSCRSADPHAPRASFSLVAIFRS